MHTKSIHRFKLAALAAAVAAALPVAAQEDDVARLVKPESFVDVGVGGATRDAPRWGMYNGWHSDKPRLLLDGEFRRRDDASGTWTSITARNLGLDNREARAEFSRQGDWGVFADYNQITRHDPYRILTGLSGINESTLRVNASSLREVKLELERRVTTLGVQKFFGRNLSAALTLRNEDKSGSRIFGRGTPGAMEFLADPHNYRTRALEGNVSYADERLQVTAGYYGTNFDNADTALQVIGGNASLAGGAAPFNPIALPPDNESHQAYVSGGYNITRGTRFSFKVAKQRATQDDTFILSPANVVGRTDLGGRIDTLQAMGGLSTRLAAGLVVNATLRYEDRDDKTPLAQYFTAVTPTSTSNGFNEPRSFTNTYGKVEGLYDLRGGWRLAARYEYDERERNTSPVRVVTFREETREHSLGLEVRKSLSETLTGSLAYVHSRRDGSDFTPTTLNSGALGSNLVAPLLLADRDRDRVRAVVDFSPRDTVSLQLVAEESRDDYKRGSPFSLGPREGRARHYALDASVGITEAWRVNAWIATDETRAEQDAQVSAPTGQLWRAELRQGGDGAGFGVRGKILNRYDSGVELSHFRNEAKYSQAAVTGAALPEIPDIHYRQTTLNVHLRVPLSKDSGVRLQYVHDRWRTDEWTWNNFTYSDGTRVLQDARQRVNFFGIAYTLAWR